MSTSPLISVCIATYNGESFIKEQLASILVQLNPFDEIIISDDHSTDKTISIIESFQDPRIQIYYNPGEKGYTPNFQHSLTKATGQYIFLADQDDIWSKDKVSLCLQYLKKYDFIVSDAIVIDNNGRVLSESFFKERNPYYSVIGNIYKFGYLGCCFAFNRKVLKKVLPFPKNHKLATHDNWIFLSTSSFYRYIILNDKLVFYRRHHNNTSSGGEKSKTSFIFKIKYRIYLIFNIIKRK